MNFNKEISFVDVVEVRNLETLNYEPLITVNHTMNANIYKLGREAEMRSFGDVTNERIVCIILGTYSNAFKYIYYEKGYYKPVDMQEIKSKTVYTLEKISEYLGDLDV